jgi:hypothetical protein
VVRPHVVRDVPQHERQPSSVLPQVIFRRPLDHLEDLVEVLRGGERSAAEVTTSVKWSRGPYESLGHVNRWLAVLETVAHLEFLVGCGVVRRVRGPGRRYRLQGGDWSPVWNTMTAILA